MTSMNISAQKKIVTRGKMSDNYKSAPEMNSKEDVSGGKVFIKRTVTPKEDIIKPKPKIAPPPPYPPPPLLPSPSPPLTIAPNDPLQRLCDQLGGISAALVESKEERRLLAMQITKLRA
jgi:hypothetical protein